jgi:hypothetical protein
MWFSRASSPVKSTFLHFVVAAFSSPYRWFPENIGQSNPRAHARMLQQARSSHAPRAVPVFAAAIRQLSLLDTVVYERLRLGDVGGDCHAFGQFHLVWHSMPRLVRPYHLCILVVGRRTLASFCSIPQIVGRIPCCKGWKCHFLVSGSKQLGLTSFLLPR